MNIFERAARAKLRFNTSKGNLSVEQLFDLSLKQLDAIARTVNSTIKANGEESFIEENRNSVDIANTLRLDILKGVIAGKQAATRAAETRAVKETLRRRIDEAISTKQDAKFDDMSEAELLAERAKLG